MNTPTTQDFINALARGLAKQGKLGDMGRSRSGPDISCALGCAAKELGFEPYLGTVIANEIGGVAFASSIADAHDVECRRVGNRGPLDGFWPRLERVCKWFKLTMPAAS